MRKPIASMLSLAVVCSLFLAMSWMIEAKGVAEASMPAPNIPVTHVEPPDPPDRTKPDDPPVTPTLRPDRGPEVYVPPPPDAQRPTIPERLIAPGSEDVIDPDFGRGNSAGETMPVATVPPQYPREALMTGTEGWVRVEFTIAPDGSVLNARVVDAHPRRGLFDDAALTAVSRWIYRPATDGDIPVASHGHRVTIEFQMANRR